MLLIRIIQKMTDGCFKSFAERQLSGNTMTIEVEK